MMSSAYAIRGQKRDIQALLSPYDALLTHPTTTDPRPETCDERRESMTLLLQKEVYEVLSSHPEFQPGPNTCKVSGLQTTRRRDTTR